MSKRGGKGWSRFAALTLSLLILAGLSSCTRHHLSDTPAARRELAKSVVGLESVEIRGQQWTAYASARTAYLIPGDGVQFPEPGVFILDPLHGAGRGAALTRDGYFLTANHVVDATDVPCMLDLGRSPGVHRGRVVERFESCDMALVKFDIRLKEWFTEWEKAPKVGEQLFAAAATGSWQQAQLSGNGGFQGSGQVIEVAPIYGGSSIGAMAAKTSLPARGGMSGAPLVNSDGGLVGVMLESRDAPLHLPDFKVSVSGMVAPEVLKRMIDEDRRKH